VVVVVQMICDEVEIVPRSLRCATRRAKYARGKSRVASLGMTESGERDARRGNVRRVTKIVVSMASGRRGRL
jgi:hypothetical protein